MAKHNRFPGQYCFIDDSGKVEIPGRFVFTEGLAAVLDENNDKWYYSVPVSEIERMNNKQQ